MSKTNRWLTANPHGENYSPDLNVFAVIRDMTMFMVFMIIFMGSWYINSEYERSLITRLGKIQTITGPGLNFKIPLFESRHVADTRMEEIKLETWIATKGGSNRVNVTMIINHRISPDNNNIKQLYKLFGSGFNYEDRLFGKAAVDRLKSSVSKHEIASVTDNRDSVRAEVLSKVIVLAEEYGILVKDLQIQSVEFPEEYMAKLTLVQTARAQAAAAKEEKIREGHLADKKIEVARGDAGRKEALATAEAFKIKTESIERAAATEREGLAEAVVMTAKAKAATQSGALADLKRAEAMKNWDGSVPQFMTGGSNAGSSIFPFMNMNEFVSPKKISKTSQDEPIVTVKSSETLTAKQQTILERAHRRLALMN